MTDKWELTTSEKIYSPHMDIEKYPTRVNWKSRHKDKEKFERRAKDKEKYPTRVRRENLLSAHG